MVEILNACNNDYQETVETLIGSVCEESIVGSLNDAKNPPITETMMKEMKEAHQSSQNFEVTNEVYFFILKVYVT